MDWPALPLDAWRDTKETLHRYAQIVGKIQLARTPMVNHYWNVTLRVTARGLATSALPYKGGMFDIELDFIEHVATVRTSDGRRARLELRPLAVAEFHRELFAALESLDIHVKIWDHPVEIPTDAIPFSTDRTHASYDRDHVGRFFRIVSEAFLILQEFRARFIGKSSEVGFYWGTFDLSVARYSGQRTANPPKGSTFENESYSHEVSEVGFWWGDAKYGQPAFFALHYPTPAGYAIATVPPGSASWHAPSNCFVLPYESLRNAPDAAAQVLDFCQSTYDVGATLAGWNRAELERKTPVRS